MGRDNVILSNPIFSINFVLVFLDLPNPWEAVNSAKTAIKVRKIEKRVYYYFILFLLRFIESRRENLLILSMHRASPENL